MQINHLMHQRHTEFSLALASLDVRVSGEGLTGNMPFTSHQTGSLDAIFAAAVTVMASSATRALDGRY
jgi:hypothetical protein